MTIETAHFELQAGEGLDDDEGGFDFNKLPTYAPFETGGILRIGAGASTGGDEEEDEGGDDDEGGAAGGPTEVKIIITSDTSFLNGGTIDMLNDVVGDELEIEGATAASYTSANGNLIIESALGATGSPTDKLEIENATVAGVTTVYVKNLGGQGAFTGRGEDDGIEIVEVEGAAGTLTPARFQLGVNAYTGLREVIGGPILLPAVCVRR